MPKQETASKPAPTLITYKGKRYDQASLIDLGEKVLTAINAQDFSWKSLVDKSFKAMVEFRD